MHILSMAAITIGMKTDGLTQVLLEEILEKLDPKVIREILVRKVVKETRVRLEQLAKKKNKDLKEILEIQEQQEVKVTKEIREIPVLKVI